MLDGDRAPLVVVPARRAAYEGYRALPVYPTLIRGEFDPAAWAADPNRRADLFDAHRTAPAADTVVGSPASGGVVEGIARIVATVEEGEVIRPGEILVTTMTNIGGARPRRRYPTIWRSPRGSTPSSLTASPRWPLPPPTAASGSRTSWTWPATGTSVSSS